MCYCNPNIRTISCGPNCIPKGQLPKVADNRNTVIENNFSYHAPKEGQPARYEALRAKAKELAYLIDELCPKSREQALAMTNLEQAMFWANASIARN